MKAARYTQGGSFEIVDVSVPEMGSDEILLRVEASSICGTDLKIIRHGHRKLSPGQTITLGHEFVGVVERVGLSVEGFLPGMRVGVAPNIGCGGCAMCIRGLGNMCPDYTAFGIDCDGAHTETIRIPSPAIAQGNVVALPDDLFPADATLAEPLSCVVNGIRSIRLEAGDVVLVCGAGPMGLLNMMMASLSGASRVIVTDLCDERLNLAKELGATDGVNSGKQSVPDWVFEQTDGRGVDVVILAAPVAQLQQEALRLLAPFGRACFFAGLPKSHGRVKLDTNAIHYKNLVLTGVTGGSPRDYRAALQLIHTKKIDVSKIVSHVFGVNDLDLAYEAALSGKAMKVVIVADASSDPRVAITKKDRSLLPPTGNLREARTR